MSHNSNPPPTGSRAASQEIAGSQWTSEWPTEPGIYLFYGDIVGLKPEQLNPRFMIVDCFQPNHGGVILSGGGVFMYKKEWKGCFRPFSEAPPADWYK